MIYGFQKKTNNLNCFIRWHSEPTLHYETLIFIMKRAVKVPGYQYFESESTRNDEPKVIDVLSFYTRCRIFVDVMIYEYLSHVLVLRWMFNIMRMFLGLIDLFPILALRSFGKKYAYVEIMKVSK